MLKGSGVCKYFGGLKALENVDFEVKDKEIVALIGPNGAGKTTLFNCISGLYPPTSGNLTLDGHEINALKPHEICRLGVGRTFQLVRPFLNMTVLENVMVGARFGSNKAISLTDCRNEAMRCIKFVGLENKKDLLARNLTFYDRRYVEIARALAIEPKLMLLDEAVSGLTPTESSYATDLITRIRDEAGITVFWIEHVMSAVMKVADRIIVLHHGEKIAEGTPKIVANDERVIDAYLGKEL